MVVQLQATGERAGQVQPRRERIGSGMRWSGRWGCCEVNTVILSPVYRIFAVNCRWGVGELVIPGGLLFSMFACWMSSFGFVLDRVVADAAFPSSSRRILPCS